MNLHKLLSETLCCRVTALSLSIGITRPASITALIVCFLFLYFCKFLCWLLTSSNIGQLFSAVLSCRVSALSPVGMMRKANFGYFFIFFYVKDQYYKSAVECIFQLQGQCPQSFCGNAATSKH